MKSSPHDHIEREVKLAANLDLALPDLSGLVGNTERLPEQVLRAAYFDTPDFRLWHHGITLRHRLGEGPASGTWTVKLPEEPTGATLDRTELSWPGSRHEIPPAASRLLPGLVRSAELHQVAELDTVRRPLELRDEKGRSWAVLDDDTVSVSGGPRDGLRFRQLEVELADDQSGGSAGRALDEVIHVLRKAGARPDGSPKLATALGLAAVSAAGSRPVDLGKRSSLEAVVRASLNAGLDRLLDHDYRLRLHADNPPAHDIHQARVATRRLRSDLKTFRPALDPIWVRRARDELRWLGSALGSVRDVDVLMSGLSSEDGASPTDAAGHRELLGHLSEQRLSACQQLAEVMDDTRYLLLLDRLHAAGQRPPFRATQGSGHPKKKGPVAESSARAALPRLVRRSWRSLHKQVRRAGDRPTNGELHRIRIEAKQLRYASEAAVPVLGERARRTAIAAEKLQTVLGEHHDAVTAEEWLWSEALVGSPWASFTAGRLTGEERRRQRRLRRRWPAVWRGLDRQKVIGWLE